MLELAISVPSRLTGVRLQVAWLWPKLRGLSPHPTVSIICALPSTPNQRPVLGYARNMIEYPTKAPEHPWLAGGLNEHRNAMCRHLCVCVHVCICAYA